jgi:hypothetical protein
VATLRVAGQAFASETNVQSHAARQIAVLAALGVTLKEARGNVCFSAKPSKHIFCNGSMRQ